MKFTALLLKSLMRNRRRTALTVISIAVSLFVFAALMSAPTVARTILADTASSVRMVVHNKAGLAYMLPQAYQQRIAKTPHVEAVAAQLWFGGIYRDVTDQFPNLAIDHEHFDVVFPDWGVAAESMKKFQTQRTACLVGPATMKRFGWKVGDRVTLRGTIYDFNLSFDIVGTFGNKAPPNFFVFRRDYLEEALGRRGWLTMFWVKVDNSSAVPQVIAAIDEGSANSSAETQSESESSFIGGFMENYRTIFTLAEVLGAIIVLTILLVAANTCAMSVRERRSEIAVMRAMGFRSSQILTLLLSESLVVAMLGGLLGCGCAYLVLKLFAVGPPGMGPLSSIQVPPAVIVQTLVVAVLIGLVSAWAPARSAARQNIVDALRAVA
ncbi:MAG: ABC transporter permease [Candidatus Binataceae bacterium]